MGRLRRANAPRSMHHPGWLCQRVAILGAGSASTVENWNPNHAGLCDLPFVSPLWLPFPPYLRLALTVRPHLTGRCAARLASGIA
jgi:hypothetical protein